MYVLMGLPRKRQQSEYNISSCWYQRLKSTIDIPITAIAYFSTFIFFTDSDVGYVMFYRLMFEGKQMGLFILSRLKHWPAAIAQYNSSYTGGKLFSRFSCSIF